MSDVFEDGERGVVVVGGREIEGRVDDATCPACGSRRIYHDTYDAFFCAGCNAWLESACGDPACEYCAGRPPEPLTR